jgi:hypothetical protein
MTEWTIDEGGGEYFSLSQEFDTAAEAQTYATSVGHAGPAIETATYLVLPATVAGELAAAKVAKIHDLTDEGNRRCALVSPLYNRVLSAVELLQTVKAASLTVLGAELAAVGAAYGAAAVVILGLPDIAAVAAYDVVTDPAWP